MPDEPLDLDLIGELSAAAIEALAALTVEVYLAEREAAEPREEAA